MLMRRFGRPGLIGLAARTAVVAGTATAVAGGMRRAQYNRAQGDAAVQQEQIRDEVAAQTAPPPAPAAAGAPDFMGELNQLAQLHSSGVLSDDEFAAAKAKLLG